MYRDGFNLPDFAVYRNHRPSGFGIVSIVLATTIMIIGVILFAVGVYWEETLPYGIAEESSEELILGLSVIVLLVLAVIGLGFGILGLFQQNRNRLTAVLGLILNGIFVLATITLIVVGLLVSESTDL